MAKSTIAAVITMALVSGVMLLILAALLYKLDVSEAFVRIGIIITYVISGAAGGYVSGRISRERRYLGGLVSGSVYFALLFLISCIAKGGMETEMVRVASTFAMCAGAGMVGGMAA
jgi:putative membrane protein (TIGR04086 family)